MSPSFSEASGDNSDLERQSNEISPTMQFKVANYEFHCKFDKLAMEKRYGPRSVICPEITKSELPAFLSAEVYLCGGVEIQLRLVRHTSRRCAMNVISSITRNGEHIEEKTAWFKPSLILFQRLIFLSRHKRQSYLAPDGSFTICVTVETYEFREISDCPIFNSEPHCRDLTISVGETNFEVDRSLLTKSSPVFEIMLTHDFREKRENRITLQDLDTVVAETLLVYILSGGGLIPQCKEYDDWLYLLIAADMYQVESLVKECEIHIERYFSQEICMTLTVALRLSNKRLIKYGLRRMKHPRIDQFGPWQEFKRNNPMLAIELCESIVIDTVIGKRKFKDPVL